MCERACMCIWGWQADAGGFEHSLRCSGLSNSSQVTLALGHGNAAGVELLGPARSRGSWGAASAQHRCPECRARLGSSASPRVGL